MQAPVIKLKVLSEILFGVHWISEINKLRTLANKNKNLSIFPFDHNCDWPHAVVFHINLNLFHIFTISFEGSKDGPTGWEDTEGRGIYHNKKVILRWINSQCCLQISTSYIATECSRRFRHVTCMSIFTQTWTNAKSFLHP